MLELIPGAAGADEAGRGPLAGPVVAAAVILPDQFRAQGLNDSKKLSQVQRERWETTILSEANYAIEFAFPDEIDELNILWASMAAMRRALLALSPAPLRVLVDGNRIPSDLPWPAEAVIKGDGKIACIAAASVLAKTARDRYMVQMAEQYPGYGFERHFGYPTPDHLEALRALGPCPIHRRSYAPVRDLIEQPCLFPDE